MDSNYKSYNHVASASRIDGILAQPQGNFEEVQKLPDRDDLTYTNGFYAYCAALFIDLRDSSTLPDHYNRPALARLYRAYISELVANLQLNTHRPRSQHRRRLCLGGLQHPDQDQHGHRLQPRLSSELPDQAAQL